MPSEWAMGLVKHLKMEMFKRCVSNVDEYWAEAFEANRIEGRIEGLEEAAKIAGNQHKEAIELRHGIGAIGGLLNVLNAIRVRIEEIKA